LKFMEDIEEEEEEEEEEEWKGLRITDYWLLMVKFEKDEEMSGKK
jgi:hypothetical protein